jgi:hypothetical protein
MAANSEGRFRARASGAAALAVLVLVLASGCGKKLKTVEVEGTLKLDNKPLEGVFVEFYPVVESGKPGLPMSTGKTGDGGLYRLTCEDGRAGAILGQHRVVIRKEILIRTEGGGLQEIPNEVPEPYRTALSTPQRVEVTEGRKTYDIDLTSTAK